MKNKRKWFIVLCCIITFIGIILLIFILQKDNKQIITIKTDSEAITSRFPNIGEFQNCYWEGDLLGSNNNRVPGPSSYWMKGFVKINDEVLTSYIETYNMKETLISKEPDFTPPDFNKNQSKWFFSDEFNKYMKPLKFSGEFYIDLQNKYIYFSVVDN